MPAGERIETFVRNIRASGLHARDYGTQNAVQATSAALLRFCVECLYAVLLQTVTQFREMLIIARLNRA